MKSKSEIKDVIIKELKEIAEEWNFDDDPNLVNLDSFQKIQLVVRIEELCEMTVSNELLLDFSLDNLTEIVHRQTNEKL